jgi:hypothetical protein
MGSFQWAMCSDTCVRASCIHRIMGQSVFVTGTNLVIVSISSAVSIPFILVAFNQDRIAYWVRGHGKRFTVWVAAILVAAILLSVVWTRDLAAGMKAAVTAVFIMLLFVGAMVQITNQIYRSGIMAS